MPASMFHLFWWNNNSSILWFSDLDSLLNPLPLQLTDFDCLHSFWFLLSSSSWLSCLGTDKFLYTIVLCLFPLSFFCGAFQESQIPLFPSHMLTIFVFTGCSFKSSFAMMYCNKFSAWFAFFLFLQMMTVSSAYLTRIPWVSPYFSHSLSSVFK